MTLERPTRESNETGRLILSYLVLLRVGFTEPSPSPGMLVSSYLTVSPLPQSRKTTAVCFLWHFPWNRFPWELPSTLPCGARTFLEPFPARGHPNHFEPRVAPPARAHRREASSHLLRS